MMRWSLSLQDFDFNIVYIKGEHNTADGLSRQYTISNIYENYSTQDKLRIIDKYHISSGHGSYQNMNFLLRKRYDWEGMNSDM